jgi:hypothetical protein
MAIWQVRGAALMCYDSWRERGPLAAVAAESRSLRKEVTPARPRARTQLGVRRATIL